MAISHWCNVTNSADHILCRKLTISRRVMQAGGGDYEIPEIRFGNSSDFVHIQVQKNILTVVVVGAPAGQLLHDAILHGLTRGWLQPGMPTLVDARKFQGRVDWSSLRAISQMTDWGRQQTTSSRVAYITRDPLFSMLVRAVSTMFPDSRHRIFPDVAAAHHWLKAEPSPVS